MWPLQVSEGCAEGSLLKEESEWHSFMVCPVGKSLQANQETGKLESFGSSHFIYSLVVVGIVVVVVVIYPMGIVWHKLQSAII